MSQSRDLILRPATREDGAALFALFEEVQNLHAEAEPQFFRPATMDQSFQAYLEEIFKDADQHLLLGCLAEAPVAFCHYSLIRRPQSMFQSARRYAYVHALAVTHGRRRQGCGLALLSQVKDWARDQGVDGIGIDRWQFNKAAGACFAKAGFEVKREYLWQVL